MNSVQTNYRKLVFLTLMVFLSGCQAATLPTSFASDPAISSQPGVPSPIVSFMAVSQSQQRLSNAVVTFGQPFVPGDVPANGSLQAITYSGQKLSTQVDWKATNDDGSRRHGIITVDLPDMSAGQAIVVGLYNAPAQPESSGLLSSATLPDVDARVVLKINGESYVAAFQKLAAQSVDRRWLSGPLTTEWHVSGPVVNQSGQPHDRIWVQFYVRRYPAQDRTRVEVIVENTWTFKPRPRDITYDAHVFVQGEEVYALRNLAHTDHARWRKVFWVGGKPKVYVRHDLSYLKATGTIPNYDPDLRVPASAVVDLYQSYQASDHGPMEVSIVTNPMGNAGGRPDIGPLPNWTVLRLLTMDPRLIHVNQAIGALAGSWPIHFRDGKTGRPVSLRNYPKLSTHPNLSGKRWNPLPVAENDEHATNLNPDVSHQPSFAFVPYLLTGDYYFLEELQFWAAWNPLETSPSYRGYDKGLMKWTQIRGQAWSMRTLAQVAYITPDENPLKDYWLYQLRSNIDWYNARYANNPDANKLGFLADEIIYDGYDDVENRGIAPWQDDFFTWAMGYLVGLGFESARPMLEFKARFPVGRMTAPGYCWVFGASYELYVREREGSPLYKTFARVYEETVNRYSRDGVDINTLACGSAAMAHQLGKSYKPGDMSGYPWSPLGFPSNMQPALAAAADAGVSQASLAWKTFMERTTKPDYSTTPVWDIVPSKLNGGADSR